MQVRKSVFEQLRQFQHFNKLKQAVLRLVAKDLDEADLEDCDGCS